MSIVSARIMYSGTLPLSMVFDLYSELDEFFLLGDMNDSLSVVFNLFRELDDSFFLLGVAMNDSFSAGKEVLLLTIFFVSAEFLFLSILPFIFVYNF